MTHSELFRDLTGTVKAIVLHGLDKAGGLGETQETSQEPRSPVRTGFPPTVGLFCFLFPGFRPGLLFLPPGSPLAAERAHQSSGDKALPVPQQKPSPGHASESGTSTSHVRASSPVLLRPHTDSHVTNTHSLLASSLRAG